MYPTDYKRWCGLRKTVGSQWMGAWYVSHVNWSTDMTGEVAMRDILISVKQELVSKDARVANRAKHCYPAYVNAHARLLERFGYKYYCSITVSNDNRKHQAVLTLTCFEPSAVSKPELENGNICIIAFIFY